MKTPSSFKVFFLFCVLVGLFEIGSQVWATHTKKYNQNLDSLGREFKKQARLNVRIPRP